MPDTREKSWNSTTLESAVYVPEPQVKKSFRDRLEDLIMGPHGETKDLILAGWIARALQSYDRTVEE